MSGLLGGSSHSHQYSEASSNSQSSNQAYPQLSNAFAPVTQQTGQAGNFISQLLGMQGGDQANDAFQKYLGSTGYGFQLGQGSQAITGNAASRGLLNSGSTLKALNNYGQQMGGQYFNNFLQQLMGYGNQGIQAGQTLAGAGQTSQSNSNSMSHGQSSQGSGILGLTGSLGI